MSEKVVFKDTNIEVNGNKVKIGVIDRVSPENDNIESIVKKVSIAKLLLVFSILIVVLSIIIIFKFY